MQAAFLVGRYVARDWVTSQIERYPVLKRLQNQTGLRVCIVVRLIPLVPFNLLNYTMGAATAVPLSVFALGSWVGMVPGAAINAALGSQVKNLADVMNSQGGAVSIKTLLSEMVGQVTAQDAALIAAGIVVLIAVLTFGGSYAQKVLGITDKDCGTQAPNVARKKA